MSHELRTPLNAIIGFSEVLLEHMFGDLNEKQAEFLQDILSSGRHLLSLINDILDLSKVEAGRMELRLEPFNLPLAIEGAITFVRERANRHRISLALALDERLGDGADCGSIDLQRRGNVCTRHPHVGSREKEILRGHVHKNDRAPG